MISWLFFAQNHLANLMRCVFAQQGESFLADDRNAEAAAVGFNERVEGFLGIQISDTSRNDTDFVALGFYPVNRTGFCIFCQFPHPFFYNHMPFDGICRHHDILSSILFIRFQSNFFRFFQFYQTLRVGNTGGQPEKCRSIECFADGICKLGEVLAFCGIGRFEHWNLGSFCIVPGILFVLGGMHAWVICNAENQTAVNTAVTYGEHWVSHDIQTNVLHAGHRTSTADGCTNGNFSSNLFVWCPFRINFLVWDNLFCNFCAWRSRIRGNDPNACFISTSCYSSIAEQ